MNCDATSTVLVIDDEMRICLSIKALLEEKGLDVQTATSVREAVEKSEKESFDLFLIDKNLPGEDGFVFMEYSLRRFPNVPAIMMTGNACVNSAVRALKQGAYDYLTKPFKYEELYHVVSKALARKKLEEENKVISAMLDASERRYREMIENSPDLIFMLNRDGQIRFVNHTVESLVGYSSKKLQQLNFLDIVHKAYTASVVDFLKENSTQTNSCMPDSGLDIELRCASNSASVRETVSVEIKKSSISLHHNRSKDEPVRDQICLVGRDIGYRKAFEEQMIYSQKMEAVTVLAGSVAHDFNNLLMGIQGYTSVLRDRLNGNEVCTEKLMAIEKSVAKGSNMTSQLLNFAKGENNSNIQTNNINCIIKDALALFSINRKDILLHLDFTSDLWGVEVDACQMEQVFLNMFINAGHAMEDGGELFIRTENVQLDDECAASMKMLPGSYIMISIEDTGHGIAKEHQKKIFEPFFSTKKESNGTGLGLASAYGIIKNHKGSISVSSEPGEGTRFKIFLGASGKVTRSKLEMAEEKQKALHNFDRHDQDMTIDGRMCRTDEKRASFEKNSRVAKLHLVQDQSIRNRGEISQNGVSQPPKALAQQGKERGALKTGTTRRMVRHSSIRKTMRALVIDDEQEVQKTVKNSLEKTGWQCIVANNGREGIQTYMEYMDKIHLVVLDMVMPGMSGGETFRYIRKLNPDAKVLIASAYNYENEIGRMMTEGGCDFLKKPYDIDQFSEKVKRLLSLKNGEVIQIASAS